MSRCIEFRVTRVPVDTVSLHKSTSNSLCGNIRTERMLYRWCREYTSTYYSHILNLEIVLNLEFEPGDAYTQVVYGKVSVKAVNL